MLLIMGTVVAQPSDTILANPKAVQLRKVWEVHGGEFGGGEVGDGFGGLGDIFGTGRSAWAVHYGTAFQWRIFAADSTGALSTTPIRIMDSLGGVPSYPIVGDFWGTGHKAVGFRRAAGQVLLLYRTDSNRLSEQPDATVHVGHNPVDIFATDLDGDGSDELIIAFYTDVWIYRGGPQFQVDTPTLKLHDTTAQSGNGIQFFVGDIDGDHHPDLLWGYETASHTNTLNMYLSTGHAVWDWQQPDRSVAVGGIVTLDCDGDSVLDIALPGPSAHVSVFLSSSGKDIRTRTLTLDDADRTYYRTGLDEPFRLGYLSDSARRYEMLSLRLDNLHMGFSGGVGGPDHSYDTYTTEFYGRVLPIGDVTGDGWEDIMSSNSTINFNAGVAELFVGGPYIPRDPSSGVEDVAIAGHRAAVSIWPNPATTELHIAWRGDLPQMPRRFVVSTTLGQQVAAGSVESWRGEALWHCGDVPAGSYLLRIEDWQGHLLVTHQIIKY